jgi:hypothetical protein
VRSNGQNHSIPILLAALLLAAMFGLSLGVALHKSPVVSEGSSLARGLVFWRSGKLLAETGSPLADLLSGLLLPLEPGLPAPQELAGYANPSRMSESLLWERGLNVTRLLLLSRLPHIWIGLLLGALVWRWARQLYGSQGAVLTLALISLSPNILAYAPFAVPGISGAFVTAAFILTWTHYTREPSLGRLAGLAALSAGMVLTGASLLFLALALPILGMAGWQHVRRKPDKPRHLLLWLVAGAGFTAATVIGVAFLVQPAAPPVMQEFAGLTAPGLWYAPLLTLILKVPLPVILLAGLASMLTLVRGRTGRSRDIFLASILYLGLSLLAGWSDLRLLLPALVMLSLLTGRLASGSPGTGWLRPAVASGLLALLLALNVLSYPDYLAFFNILAGAIEPTSQVLSGSNRDWGQDLPALSAYLIERGSGSIYLSYAGEADPAYYGISYQALPSSTTPAGSAPQADLTPLNPAPGLYVIGASNLASLSPAVDEALGYFRMHPPVGWIGNSMAVYEVSPASSRDNGSRHWLAQCGHPDDPPLIADPESLTGLPDLKVMVFDCLTSLPVWPGSGWIALPGDASPLVDLGVPDYTARQPGGLPRLQVWEIEQIPPAPDSSITFPLSRLPLPIAGYIELLGYQVEGTRPVPGEPQTVTTWWRVRAAPPESLSLSVSLLGQDNVAVYRAEGIGVPFESWEAGLIFIQRHILLPDAEAPPGTYALAVSVVGLESGARYPVFQSSDRVIDQIILREIEIVEAAR